ncbi:MAG: response regulator [Anaerolineae bacterium]|nr:response regulator [Anaerolineae bacterium]
MINDRQNKAVILIADDNVIVQEMLGELLSSSGHNYDLVFAENGQDAVEKSISILPDLILLDVMMPKMNGYEVCERLRNHEKLAEVPILMVTALDDRESRVRGLNAGADDFISKPFYGEELMARVNTIVRLNRYRGLRDERAKLEDANEELLLLNTRLQQVNDELQTAYDATIKGWARALELRDQETQGHSQRVVAMSIHLAQLSGITESEKLNNLRRGAILHDVGKMGVPDHILLKAGPLTPQEWDVMRLHTIYGYDMLKPIEYLRPALDVVLYHHERWDGTGYPEGLSGENIPLPARVFAVGDVWDALRHSRPYKAPWLREKVISYIQSESGRGFDPKIVDTFLKAIQDDVIWE